MKRENDILVSNIQWSVISDQCSVSGVQGFGIAVFVIVALLLSGSEASAFHRSEALFHVSAEQFPKELSLFPISEESFLKESALFHGSAGLFQKSGTLFPMSEEQFHMESSLFPWSEELFQKELKPFSATARLHRVVNKQQHHTKSLPLAGMNEEFRMKNLEYRREEDSVQPARLVKRTGVQCSVPVFPATSCHLEGRMTERSVTLELDSNGFSLLPPHRCKRGTPLLKKEGKRSCYRLCCVFQKLELEKEYFSSLRRSTPDTIGREVVRKPEEENIECRMINAEYRREENSVLSARLVKRTGAQSQYSVAVISTKNESLSRFVGKRSVTMEQGCNGFSLVPPHRCKRGTPLLEREGKRSYYRLCCVFQKLELEKEYFSSSQEEYSRQVGREVVLKPEASSLPLAAKKKLTTKNNNSPSRRVRSTHKNAHLSEFNQEVGIQKSIKTSSIHILAMSRNVLPLGGRSRHVGRGVWGLTNTLKTKHAYET